MEGVNPLSICQSIEKTNGFIFQSFFFSFLQSVRQFRLLLLSFYNKQHTQYKHNLIFVYSFCYFLLRHYFAFCEEIDPLIHSSPSSLSSLSPLVMSLRFRKEKDDDLESGGGSEIFSGDQSTLLSKLTQLQQKNRELERTLATTQNQLYAKSYQKDDIKVEDRSGLSNDLYDRGSWLIGLLILQSCSSFILANYEKLLSEHQALIYFLTMLVGAGGNAGNQACVKIVRELAIGIVFIFVKFFTLHIIYMCLYIYEMISFSITVCYVSCHMMMMS